MSNVTFNHKAVPVGEPASVQVAFEPVSIEITGEAGLVSALFGEICRTSTFIDCMKAALEGTTPAEVIKAMRSGGFPEQQVAEFERSLGGQS